MIDRIIALRGRGGIGKTTTIVELADELVNRGWLRESRVLHGNGIDITDVYVGQDGIRLGVASAGDNFREVDGSLRILFDADCTVVICACRTRDMPDANNVVRGTHFAMRQFTQNITFVNKTIIEVRNQLQRDNANTQDINRLINNI